jgi:YidC/Oxa1 family membrane protein insertase
VSLGFFELFSGVLAGFYALIPSYGAAIILLTLAVRILILPLSIKQTRMMRESQNEMQRVQPQIKKLQAKYKDNRQKLNEEMMKVYKEHGVNPLAPARGCLPLLLQMPVFIGLFYVVREPLKYLGYKAVQQGEQIIGWDPIGQVSGLMQTLQDSALARGLDTMPEVLNRFLGLRLDCSASGIISPPAPGEAAHKLAETCPQGMVAALPYLLLVLLMGLTTWYQQQQMQASRDATDAQAQQMKMFSRIMPPLLMFFTFSFPVGVVLYWLTTNMWTIAQQRIILKTVPPVGAPGTGGKPARTPGSDGKSGGKPAPGTRQAGATETKGGGNGKPASGKEGSKPSPSSRKKKKR